MLEGAFSFRGRIGRLNYFLGGLLILPAAIGAGLLLGLLMAGAHRGAASALFFGASVFVLVVVAVWYSLSLHVRRIRDIGWSPLYVIVGWLVVRVADVGLAMQVPALAIGHGHQTTIVGALVNLVLSGALLFWPGRDRADIVAVFDDPPAPRRRDAVVSAPPAPGSMAVGVLPRGGARKEFGRRGLR